jgi:hypothetical protein
VPPRIGPTDLRTNQRSKLRLAHQRQTRDYSVGLLNVPPSATSPHAEPWASNEKP